MPQQMYFRAPVILQADGYPLVLNLPRDFKEGFHVILCCGCDDEPEVVARP